MRILNYLLKTRNKVGNQNNLERLTAKIVEERWGPQADIENEIDICLNLATL